MTRAGVMPAFIYTEQIMIIVAKRTLKHMKETKLKRLIKKMMDCVFLDAMTPEFKAANAELLKAIKMNDKSGAVPHADLEAVNKAMKENDAVKAGDALKKVQLQFSKAEKKLDDDVKSIQAKLETTKKTAETAKASLKQKKALTSVFDKLKTLVTGLSNNPKSASKLAALTDKVKDYGDLSKHSSQIITLVSSNKDASKQIDMLKKSVDAAEKKYKKDLANAENESKKADDALEVAKMQVKITQGKRDAFTKERLYIANVVKQMPQGDLRKGREQKESTSNVVMPAEPPGIIEARNAKMIEKAAEFYKKISDIKKRWNERAKDEKKEYDRWVNKPDPNLNIIERLMDKAKTIKFKFNPEMNMADNSANEDILDDIGVRNDVIGARKRASEISKEYKRIAKHLSFEDRDSAEQLAKIYESIADTCIDVDVFDPQDTDTRPDLPESARKELITRRIELFSEPYYKKIQEILNHFGIKAQKVPESEVQFKKIVEKQNKQNKK